MDGYFNIEVKTTKKIQVLEGFIGPQRNWVEYGTQTMDKEK